LSRIPALLAILILFVVSVSTAWAVEFAPLATCPFQYNDQNGEIRVNVKINGKGPFSMKLDTGSTMSLITPEVAKLAGIEALSRTYPCGAYGANVSLGSGTIGSMQMGAVSLYEQPCFIGNLNDAIPCDGILSGAIFDQFAVQLDFTKDTISFYGGGAYQPGPKDVSIPFHLQGNHIPVCEGAIDDIPVKLAIDTGFDGSLTLLPDFVRENRLEEKCRKVTTVTTYSLEGTREVGLYAMNQLDVGTGSDIRQFGRICALFDDFDTSAVQYNYDGLLGAKTLSHWTVTFDYAHSRIVFH
jgi:predicted aspartyl protease